MKKFKDQLADRFIILASKIVLEYQKALIGTYIVIGTSELRLLQKSLITINILEVV